MLKNFYATLLPTHSAGAHPQRPSAPNPLHHPPFQVSPSSLPLFSIPHLYRAPLVSRLRFSCSRLVPPLLLLLVYP
jgi:hypothetical protein